jgi:serine O-acetyltransferase
MLIADLHNEIKIISDRDPAAKNWLEVLICYPGVQAILFHRVAHWINDRGIPLIPRMISNLGRFLTGIEIHPGATIGKGVFIDHGMGVVIGETAIVGDFTLIYQGVTLGGTGKQTGKRHPTVGENVVVGAGAKVLGNISIGNNVRIGAGSVVLRDIPSDCTVVGIPGRIVRQENNLKNQLNHQSFPDVEALAIRALFDRIKDLEDQISHLNGEIKDDLELVSVATVHRNGHKKYDHSVENSLIEDFLDGAGI